jgi:PEP-CTERM motif
VLACMVVAQTSEARKIEGFEAGDPAFTKTGDAGNQGTYQTEAPPEGSFQFLITTIGTGNEDGALPQSGTASVAFSTLNTFFKNTTVSNEDGSAILIPFNILSGDTSLTFQYDFLSNEPAQSPARNDFAFAALFDPTNTLVGSVNHFATVTGSLFSNFGAQSPFIAHTGPQTFTLSLVGLAPGAYTFGIGVTDVTNIDHASGLLIDNVQVAGAAVPEPSTVGLGIAGAVLMVALRSRIKRKS